MMGYFNSIHPFVLENEDLECGKEQIQVCREESKKKESCSLQFKFGVSVNSLDMLS